MLNTNEHRAYIVYAMDASEYHISYSTDSSVYTFAPDHVSKTTQVRLPFKAYNVEDVVKVRYTYDNIKNETAFRITDVI